MVKMNKYEKLNEHPPKSNSNKSRATQHKPIHSVYRNIYLINVEYK